MADAFKSHLPSSSAQGRRARLGRKDAAARERRILMLLTAGVNGAEIARREGISLRRMQQLTKAIFARRRDALPEHFIDVQTMRLEEALTVAFGAMGGGNLRAIDRVVKIVRELDRYQGFPRDEPLLTRTPGEKRDAKQIAAQVVDQLRPSEIALALAGPAVADNPLSRTPLERSDAHAVP